MRRAAAAALLLIAALPASALDASLRARAKSPDEAQRATAAKDLGADGSVEAARILADLLTDRSGRVRDAAVVACGSLTDPEAVKAIVPVARSADELARRNGAEALGRTRSPAALPALEHLALRDASAQVRADALDALGRFGGERAAFEIAARAASDRSPFARAAAVEAAGRTGLGDATAIVTSALADADDGVRCVARAELLRVARADALAGLAAAARDPSWRVRAQCVDDAAQLREAPAVEALVALTGDDVTRVAAAAHRALQRLSGLELGRDRDLWAAWWATNKAAWKAPAGDARADAPDDLRRTTARYHGLGVATGAATFVADLSGSMEEPAGRSDRRSRWDVAAQELRVTLTALPESFVVNVVFFQNQPHRAFSKPQTLGRATRDRIEAFIAGGSPGQCGDLAGGVLAALEDDAIDTVYLLSDGAPSFGDVVDRGRVRSVIRQRNRTRKCIIDTIGFGARKAADRSFLTELARESGGRAVFRGEGER